MSCYTIGMDSASKMSVGQLQLVEFRLTNYIAEKEKKPILQQIDNPEMLIGFILVVISLVGLAGGNLTISNFTVKFKRTARAGS